MEPFDLSGPPARLLTFREVPDQGVIWGNLCIWGAGGHNPLHMGSFGFEIFVVSRKGTRAGRGEVMHYFESPWISNSFSTDQLTLLSGK